MELFFETALWYLAAWTFSKINGFLCSRNDLKWNEKLVWGEFQQFGEYVGFISDDYKLPKAFSVPLFITFFLVLCAPWIVTDVCSYLFLSDLKKAFSLILFWIIIIYIYIYTGWSMVDGRLDVYGRPDVGSFWK